MEIGEKYLSIKIVGHDFVPAFPNKDKQKENEPDYKGDGVAVWVRKKGENKTTATEQSAIVENV